ncbi:hypothetical protein ACRALDRAFT_212712 [Sodiomyces alcalophilus JCM 7366]|uniref:uncharacterized protein n=1 Tax=Sodiomyces alcalophilus JCM 7366 TaxID=591952 RepID=UPI0039B57F96
MSLIGQEHDFNHVTMILHRKIGPGTGSTASIVVLKEVGAIQNVVRNRFDKANTTPKVAISRGIPNANCWVRLV